MDDYDAWGNRLPRATRGQLAKEQATFNRISRELDAAAKE